MQWDLSTLPPHPHPNPALALVVCFCFSFGDDTFSDLGLQLFIRGHPRGRGSHPLLRSCGALIKETAETRHPGPRGQGRGGGRTGRPWWGTEAESCWRGAGCKAGESPAGPFCASRHAPTPLHLVKWCSIKAPSDGTSPVIPFIHQKCPDGIT